MIEDIRTNKLITNKREMMNCSLSYYKISLEREEAVAFLSNFHCTYLELVSTWVKLLSVYQWKENKDK